MDNETHRMMMRIKDLEEESQMLREHINNMLERTCAFFCALPECPKGMRKEEDDEQF